jgi:hypothetical protein
VNSYPIIRRVRRPLEQLSPSGALALANSLGRDNADLKQRLVVAEAANELYRETIAALRAPAVTAAAATFSGTEFSP